MEVKLILCNTQSLTNTANYIIKKYHSYVPTTNSVGRRIDWLVSCDGEIVGMIGIGSATYPPCKDVLNYLGITKSQYKDMFNQIGNNWRFCISGNIRNLGTMVLRQFRKQAKDIWKKYYGDETIEKGR